MGAIGTLSEEIKLQPGGPLLHRFGEPTVQLLFPCSGIVSLTVPTPEGQSVEVALVGREGMFGVNSLFGGAGDLEAMAQVAGKAIAVPLRSVQGDLATSLRRAVEHYAANLVIELAQTAACNRLHTVEERTARWLLHMADRAETTDLHLTHEFLAMMLGVRRASVTVVVGGFEAAGLIDARRRLISVADREGLKQYACSCYEVIRGTTARAQN